jgi:hypothetical protein
MMILCPNDHAAATEGALIEQEQRAYKNNPFNMIQGYAEGQLKSNQTYCVVSFGNNCFVGNSCFLKVNNESLLGLELDSNGRMLLSLRLYDPKDNLLIFIDRNEWISGDPLPWDIKSSYQRLEIRRKNRDVALSVNLRSSPAHLVADLWKSGQHIEINEYEFLLHGIRYGFIGMIFIAVHFNIDTDSKDVHILPDPRYIGKAGIKPYSAGRSEAHEEARVAWHKLIGT